MNIFHATNVFLIPGLIESRINYANRNSNFGLYGIYTEVKKRRNFIYITSITGGIFLFSGEKIIGSLIIFIPYILYVNFIRKYLYYL